MALSPARKLMNAERSSESPSDRFSDLPKHLIHQIMTLLRTTDSTRMSVLSKRFLDAWRSFPVIDFDYDAFCHRGIPLTAFFAFIQDSIRYRRLEFNDLESLTFRLDLSVYAGCVWETDLRVIGMVIENFAMNNRVRKLELECLNTSYVVGLPVSVFSCCSIRTLTLSGIYLDGEKDFFLSCPLIEVFSLDKCHSYDGTSITLSSARLKSARFCDCIGLERIEIEGAAASLESFSFFMMNEEKPVVNHYNIINLGSCKSLKSLELAGLEITEEWFKDTVSNLAALEVLELRNCGALESVRLRNERLQRVDLQECHKLESVDVVAENLEFFRFSLASNILERCQINIGRCKNLKELILRGVKGNLNDEWVQKNFTQPTGFRFLENLVLEGCNLLEKLNLSAEHLKTMELLRCKKLLTAEIDAPNLVSFVYSGVVLPLLPPIVTSVHFHAELYLFLEENGYGKLRNFLSSFGHCKSLTLVCKCDKLQLIFPEEQRSSLVSPMYGLKKLNLRLVGNFRYSTTVELIDNMLWLAPQLNSLSISFGPEKRVVLQFYYKPNCHQECGKNQPQCCSSSLIKCWRHCLRRVDVEAFGGFKLEANDLQRFFMNKATLKYHHNYKRIESL